jgi:hypothetical protein
MPAISLVMRLDVAATVIWHFEIALDQKIRAIAIQLIRVLFDREGGLVIVAADRDPSGYIVCVEFHDSAVVWN